MNDKKYRSIILDTINGVQNKLYLRHLKDVGKANYDMWRDYGTEILDLYDWMKRLDDVVLVQVLGHEGTGKTVGGSFLNPEETAWLNADGKPLTFFGARNKYPIDNSKKNYKEVEDYETVKKQIFGIHGKRKGTLIIFINGHIEDYKAEAGEIRQRLRILGKMATKLGVEGLNLSHTYYTKVDANLPHTDVNRYKLTTANSGYNTARSPQGYWEQYEISNNYQTIVDRILEDYGN